MLHTRAREDGQLLTSDKSHERINRGNTCVDIVLGINSRNGVDGRRVNVTFFNGVNLTESVDRSAESVKNSADDFGRKAQFNRVTRHSRLGVDERKTFCTLKYLNNDLFALDFYYTACS